ncbi:MAG: NYN domain-containing protein [bacterium]|nr:NYN domain-containing protein [bacterium]
MKNGGKNFAYIDGANLHKGISELGWHLDYKRFRVWLSEKYGVNKAYIFLGFISSNTNLYRNLQNWGYTVVFKPTVPGGYGEIKGNCDAEMVLQAVSDMYEKLFEKAVLVTGDGDFACLVNFLKERKRFEVVLSPNAKKASVLLKKSAPESIIFLERFKSRLEYDKNERSGHK